MIIEVQLLPTRGTEELGKVYDGDTPTIDKRSVRMLAIDAPELAQPRWGQLARRWLLLALEGQSFRMEKDKRDTDLYGRLLRWIYVGDRNINVEIVRAGMADTYKTSPNPKYWNEITIAAIEAKKMGVGIWSDPTFVLPKDWRKGKR